jgi:hypothetical protein
MILKIWNNRFLRCGPSVQEVLLSNTEVESWNVGAAISFFLIQARILIWCAGSEMSSKRLDKYGSVYLPMKTETLIKIAIATGIIAVIALVLAYLENKNSASNPVGSLRRWMILVIIFVIAAAVTAALIVTVLIRSRRT